jgi:thiol-disulfide isomerase/thioredoxin
MSDPADLGGDSAAVRGPGFHYPSSIRLCPTGRDFTVNTTACLRRVWPISLRGSDSSDTRGGTSAWKSERGQSSWARSLRLAPFLALGLAAAGCNDTTTTSPVNISETPPNVLSPAAPDEGKDAAVKTESKPEGSPEGQGSASAPSADKVELIPIKYDEMRKQIAVNKAKLTMIDAWATWCGPCKENFPHVVAMHKQFADQGLNVISLSLDDSTEPKVLEEAKKFLEEQHAVFTNYVLTDEQNAAFDKLNVNGIPAVFLFGPDGQEIKRFTGDDPNDQFTYDQVERTVAAMLKGEPAPSAAAADKE